MASEQEPGLRQSRWAPALSFNKINTNNNNQPQTPSVSSPLSRTAPPLRQASSAPGPSCLNLDAAQQRIPTPWAELARYTKIVRRLKWKLPFLSHGYGCATNQSVPRAEKEEAELMFKLDFFEYYMLLERALIHLLSVFGIKVTGALNGGGSNGGEKSILNGNRGGKPGQHRFHANVLKSLDDPANPLHRVLGQNTVRDSLARAKELRNRWKNADEPATMLPQGDKCSRPLTDYDLGHMLGTIFDGLDLAFGIANRYVTEVRASAAQRGVGGADVSKEQDDEWEFMVEAMDWEAV